MAAAHSSSAPARKKPPGRPFQKGQSGNAAGRPSLPEAFKQKGPEALGKLVEFMAHKDSRIALRATEFVVERIYGKAAQPLEHDAGAEMLDILAERLQKRLTESRSGISPA